MRVFPEGPTVQVATAEPGSVSFIKLVRMERARACRSNSLEQSRHRSPGVLHVFPPARQIERILREISRYPKKHWKLCPAGIDLSTRKIIAYLYDAHSFLSALLPALQSIKLSLSAYAHLIKFWEVNVMQAKSARQFPDAFNRIELRTIRPLLVETLH
jgi:hypothetical protein